MNRSSAQQGNPNRNRVGREETDAREPTDPQPGLTTIPDRVFVEAHLRTVRPECDQPESPFDDAEVRIGRGLKHPKDKGYGKFLETLGYDRNWAGMQAAMIVEEGRVRAATSKRSWEFAQALRRLANPGLETKAFLAAAKVAREAMDGTELTRGLFEGLPRFAGLLFIRALKFCLAGDLSHRVEVSRLQRPFGAASSSHAVRNSPMRLPRMSIFSRLNRSLKMPRSLGRRKRKISPTH